MNKKLMYKLIIIFVITQLIGLFVGTQLIQENVKATIVSENPEDPINAIALMAYILVVTGILLLAIKVIKGKYIFKSLELLAIFGTSLIVFGSFIPSVIFVLGISLFLVLLRIVFSKNILLRNITSTISIAGVGALIGVSLGILPILLFIILLSAYDLIAVFKTKHMITLAKNITQKNLSFTVALPTKEKTFELGTGDLVIPLTFAVSVLNATSLEYPLKFLPPAAILIASLIGLVWTVDFCSKKPGRALPALPPQTLLMATAFAIMFFAGAF